MKGRILIIGKNGYIARRISTSASLALHTLLYISSSKNEGGLVLDLGRPDEFNYDMIEKGDLVLMLAAVSSPDTCKDQYSFAYNVNVRGTARLMEKVIERQGRILFFSSDTVYGNRIEEFDERAKAAPLGEYAKMKFEIENMFQEERNVKVFRLAYVFSRDDKFTGYLRRCSEKGIVAEVFASLRRRIVFIDDLVDGIASIAEKWDVIDERVINLSGPELLSRLDLAEIYKAVVDRNLRIRVVQPDAGFFEARPESINMVSLHFANLLGRTPISIRRAMELEFVP